MTDDLDGDYARLIGAGYAEQRWTPDQPDDDGVYFRLGADAVKLLPSPGTTIRHLGLEMADTRPDLHDPDGNELRFVAA